MHRNVCKSLERYILLRFTNKSQTLVNSNFREVCILEHPDGRTALVRPIPRIYLVLTAQCRLKVSLKAQCVDSEWRINHQNLYLEPV